MLRKVVRWCSGLYLAWVLLVVFLLWPLLNVLPHHLIREHLHREFHSELILFNPFTLTLEVRRAVLHDSDRSPMVSADYLQANLGIASLWRRALWLQDVTVLGPRVNLVSNPDGELNLLAMLPERSEPQPATPAGDPFPLRIELLHLSGGQVDVEDRATATPWRTGIHGLTLRARDLSTVAGVEGSYHLSLQAREGGALESEGRLALGDSSVEGELALAGLQLAPGVRRAAPLLPFVLKAGTLDFSTRFDLNWRDALEGGLTAGQLALGDVAALPRDSAAWPDTHLRLRSLSLDGLNLDLGARTVRAGTLQLEGMDAAGWQEGEQISLLALLPDTAETADQAETEKEGRPATGSTGAAQDGSDWRIALERFSLIDSRAHWRSSFTDPALTVEPLALTLRDLQWPAQAAWPLQLDLGVNRQAELAVEGELHAGDGSGQLAAQLKGLPLEWFAPNLPATLRAEIGGGTLASQARILLREFQPAEIGLDGAIDDFLILIRGVEDELTSWKQLAWQDVQINLPQQQVDVGSVLLDGFSGRLHIDPEGNVNVTRVLAAENGSPADAPAADEAAAAPAATADATGSWQVAVPEIQVTDSALDFMDESLPIRFRTVIGDLEGSITGFRLDPDADVAIDLSGAVDGYAPVSLAGRAMPLRSPPDLQLALNFRGIDMARLSPYSATYAGYAIERGTLTVDLNYQLENKRLQGRNQVVISQLRLGEQVASDRALDLPLRLGIALLTDSRGVIDLDVPVSGDLDNPRFSLGSVIAGAFVNLLRQAVTAPFNLLASLVGSEADLRQVDFAAGSVALDEHGSGKLEDLARALQQRPALDLIVSGQVNHKTDGRQLRETRLREELLAAGLGPEDIDQRSEAWARAIGERYGALQGERVEESAEPPSALAQFRAVRDALKLPENALRELASERSASIKRFLVNQAGIAPERVTIDSPEDSEGGSSAAIMEVAA